MKRLFIVCSVLFLSSGKLLACDICGCGVSNYNPFLFPHLSRSYLGLSWYHRLYQTHSDNGVTGKESYHSILISGQYSPLKNLQLVALLPYQVNKLNSDKGVKNISGLGDVSFIANWRLLDKAGEKFRQAIIAGGGVKLPTGKYNSSKSETINDQNFQLGSGSLDYLLNASYQLSYGKWVLSTASSYKYNTANKDGYRFGDVLTNGVTLVYRKDLAEISIVPYLQVINETQMKDANRHILQDHSGGNVLYTGGGIDINTKSFTVGANYQFAAKQNLAEGQINVKPRFVFHLSFTL
jgi:hypothetical protein